MACTWTILHLNVPGRHDSALTSQSQHVENKEKWSLVHCYFANMGGIYYSDGETSFPVTAIQIAREASFKYPEVTKQEIEDRSKQDWFTKAIATFQISQLVLSVLVRLGTGLEFSQLEAVTLAFALCGVAIYLTYLFKPQNVSTAIMLKQTGPVPPQERESSTGQACTKEQPASPVPPGVPLLRFTRTYDSFWAVLMNQHGLPDEETGDAVSSTPVRVTNDNIPLSERSNDTHAAVFALALASGLFGALHAIAWKSDFPTSTEQMLWWAATVVSATSPIAGLLAIPLTQLTVSAGDARMFLRNCLRLSQEYSWHATEKGPVKEAIQRLESAYIHGTKEHYSGIFSKTGDDILIRDVGDFLEMTGDFAYLRGRSRRPLDLHGDDDFIQHFRLLVRAVGGREAKKINETAQTHDFPQRLWLPKWVNRSILFATSALYCLSRLVLLAVALSSLRRMPASVYTRTAWTKYIPTMSSGGG
ncbi:hypothetical protein NOR_01906 [Metarhizium rileyi]|uniref:Uncharacterized protein n=1 Tax=Metarhizium rileyi (strain RCEF 4871) TaxID=1649241 RepID=A0A167I4A3_METRR|nr:hypothetical protein NOR_01906 [Metarhizium rileyi RCEF 4871]